MKLSKIGGVLYIFFGAIVGYSVLKTSYDNLGKINIGNSTGVAFMIGGLIPLILFSYLAYWLIKKGIKEFGPPE